MSLATLKLLYVPLSWPGDLFCSLKMREWRKGGRDLRNALRYLEQAESFLAIAQVPSVSMKETETSIIFEWNHDDDKTPDLAFRALQRIGKVTLEDIWTRKKANQVLNAYLATVQQIRHSLTNNEDADPQQRNIKELMQFLSAVDLIEQHRFERSIHRGCSY